MIQYNVIENGKVIQVYGSSEKVIATGWAFKRVIRGQICYGYELSFVYNKAIYKILANEEQATIHNVKDLEAYVNKLVQQIINGEW